VSLDRKQPQLEWSVREGPAAVACGLSVVATTTSSEYNLMDESPFRRIDSIITAIRDSPVLAHVVGVSDWRVSSAESARGQIGLE